MAHPTRGSNGYEADKIRLLNALAPDPAPPIAKAATIIPMTRKGSFAEQLRERAGMRAAVAATPPIEKIDPEPIAFLKSFDPHGRHTLVAIKPDQAGAKGKTFEPGMWAEMTVWIAERRETCNLYYSVNEPIAGAPDKKPSAQEIAQIRGVFVDIDPGEGLTRKEIEAIVESERSGPCPPSFAVDSGNGMQLVYRLANKLPADAHREWAEGQSRGLAQRLRGDPAVHDVARILRLPGTLNLPDARKRAKGRVKAASRVVASSGRIYQPEALRAYQAPAALAAKPGGDSDAKIAATMAALDIDAVQAATSFEDLPPDLIARFSEACLAAPQLHALWSGDASALGEDTSRSGWRFSLARQLHRIGGFTVQDYGSLLSVWPHAFKDGELPDDQRLIREIARGWENAAAGMPKALDPQDFFQVEPTEPAKVRKWETITVAEALRRARGGGRPPLIKGLLDRGVLSVLYAPSNVGKTFITLDLAAHIALGRPWLGRRVHAGPVLYIAAEGGEGVFKRCAALHAVHGEAFEHAPFHIRCASIDFRDPRADASDLIAEVATWPVPPSFIAVDTVARAMAGGDENSPVDMGSLVNNCGLISEATGAHVMLVHHTGKDKARGARGHSSLRAATDTEIEITEDREFKVTKQRDMGRNFTVQFEFVVHCLGKDADGDDLTSCTVRFVPMADDVERAVTPAQRHVLEALGHAAEETGWATASQIAWPLADLTGKPSKANMVRKHLSDLARSGRVRWRGPEKSREWSLGAHRLPAAPGEHFKDESAPTCAPGEE